MEGMDYIDRYIAYLSPKLARTRTCTHTQRTETNHIVTSSGLESAFSSCMSAGEIQSAAFLPVEKLGRAAPVEMSAAGKSTGVPPSVCRVMCEAPFRFQEREIGPNTVYLYPEWQFKYIPSS